MNDKVIKRVQDKCTKYRREFHRFPELGWHEFRTSARVAEILSDIGYEVLMGADVVNRDSIGEPERLSEEETRREMERAIDQGASPEYLDKTGGLTGVVAVLDTGRDGPVTAFRFDMDCLPGVEPEKPGYRPFDEGYISANPGYVHACGHDGHTSIGLGLAEVLMEARDELRGRIKFIFQPAEETYYGAKSIVDKGHLDDCDYFIALHIGLSHDNEPLPSGTIACGCKDFLSARQLDVMFNGRAAHPCGASQEGKNALLAACSAALNLHAIAPHEKGLFHINVGEIHAGICTNTIAPDAVLKLEYRGAEPEITEYAERRVFDVLDGTARAYDLTYDYIDYGEIPAGKSDDEMMMVIREIAKDIPWFEKVYDEGNVGGSDDATIMLTHVQKRGGIGTYIGIGADTTSVLHDPEFDYDEDCMGASIRLCAGAVAKLHAIRG